VSRTREGAASAKRSSTSERAGAGEIDRPLVPGWPPTPASEVATHESTFA
jgi:hypothetical protein